MSPAVLRHGSKVKVATLRNGRFQMFFASDNLRRIGSAARDIRLRRVAYPLPRFAGGLRRAQHHRPLD